MWIVSPHTEWGDHIILGNPGGSNLFHLPERQCFFIFWECPLHYRSPQFIFLADFRLVQACIIMTTEVLSEKSEDGKGELKKILSDMLPGSGFSPMQLSFP